MIEAMKENLKRLKLKKPNKITGVMIKGFLIEHKECCFSVFLQ